jgi:hypothetical protein
MQYNILYLNENKKLFKFINHSKTESKWRINLLTPYLILLFLNVQVNNRSLVYLKGCLLFSINGQKTPY